jgi:hypothetical protein
VCLQTSERRKSCLFRKIGRRDRGNIYGPIHGSVIRIHNKADLTNHFDFRSIEQRIEREGGEDKEELKRGLAQVDRLLERGEYLDRGALPQFSGAMERRLLGTPPWLEISSY